MQCPDNIKQRGKILNYNGFGYQAPGQGTVDTFVIAILSDDYPLTVINKVKQDSGSDTLATSDFLGRTFATVMWWEYHLIDKVLTSMLRHKLTFITQNKLQMRFGENDQWYSQEIAERKWLDYFFKQSPSIQQLMIEGNEHNFFHEWNWASLEGKLVCSKLRTMFNKSEYCLAPEKHNYTNWPIFENCDWNTLQTISRGVLLTEKEEEEDNECMICMDQPANTMVLPCEHCVVCKTCSVKLRDTNDAQICVKCRRPIEHILE